MKKTLMIVAGESSGDLHGSEIASRLSRSNNDIYCVGMGSQKMRESGVELLFDCASIAVVGLWEVLTHWSDIKRAMRKLENHIIQSPPDLLLLIDYQEFNLRLARFAKQRGIKVLFYVSPQLWAWRKGRIKKFANIIDMMAVIFPFEVKYFEGSSIPVRYVGHPLTNKVTATVDRQSTLIQYRLNSDNPVVGLLPGSRRSEIQRILPILLDTAKLLALQIPGIQFILPIAHTSLLPAIQKMINEKNINIRLIEENRYNAINTCSAVIVASGTATLEVALLGIPMAIVYRVAPLTYAILSRMISIPFIGLANIVAGQQVAKEYVQGNAEPEGIASEIKELLLNDTYADQARVRLELVKSKLGESDGIEGISNLVLEMLNIKEAY